MTKSIKLKPTDILRLNTIIAKDFRISKGGYSEAIRLTIESSYKKKPNWNKLAYDMRYNDLTVDDTLIANIQEVPITNFTVDKDLFDFVLNNIKSALNLDKPRISYVVRLCIFFLYSDLTVKYPLSDNELEDTSFNVISDVSLIRIIAELLESDSEEAKKKISEIKKVLINR